MEQVPNIISGKDLDYLSDMFNWNYGAYKCTKNAYDNASDNEIKNILECATKMFYDILIKFLSILKYLGKID